MISIVTPALAAGIHVLNLHRIKDMDGRDQPGHDRAQPEPHHDLCKNATLQQFRSGRIVEEIMSD
jgi:hypothetical protein